MALLGRIAAVQRALCVSAAEPHVRCPRLLWLQGFVFALPATSKENLALRTALAAANLDSAWLPLEGAPVLQCRLYAKVQSTVVRGALVCTLPEDATCKALMACT